MRFNPRAFLLYAAIVAMPAAAQEQRATPRSWSGVIISSACNADEAFNGAPDCSKQLPGAKLALYDDTTRVVYGLEPQKQVTAHLGDTVTLTGTLAGESINLESVKLMSIGLAVGQRAPDFSLRDQFGNLQTLDSLKGSNGTVLLFFRSADW